MNRMQLATIAPVMAPATAAGDLRDNQGNGAALTSLRVGSQQRAQTSGAPISQKLGALAIITATRSPTKLVNTLPRNIRQAARRRGSRRSKTANSTDFKTTAIASTRIEPHSASAGTMTCINGTTGSHANAGFATKTETPTSRSIESLGLSTGTPSPQRSTSKTWLFRRCSSS